MTIEQSLTQVLAGTTGVYYFQQDDAAYVGDLLAESLSPVLGRLSTREYGLPETMILLGLKNPKKLGSLSSKVPRRIRALQNQMMKLEDTINEYTRLAAESKALDREEALEEGELSDREDTDNDLYNLAGDIDDLSDSNTWNPWPISIMTFLLFCYCTNRRMDRALSVYRKWIAHEREEGSDLSFIKQFALVYNRLRSKSLQPEHLGLKHSTFKSYLGPLEFANKVQAQFVALGLDDGTTPVDKYYFARILNAF